MFKKAVLAFSLALAAFFWAGGQTDLLGPLSREAILQARPDWQEVMAAYQPEPLAVEGLKAFDRQVQVEVFLGTWCPDSKAHVSELFKVLDMADNPLISASYIGLPRDKAQRSPYVQGQDIQRIPTFIVSVEGQEKGRVVEVPQKSMEQDLLDILRR